MEKSVSNKENNSTVVAKKTDSYTVKTDTMPVVCKISLKDRLELALKNQFVQKALHAIRQAEHNHGSAKDVNDKDLYWIKVGGEKLTDLNDHPGNKPGATKGNLYSGAYQIGINEWNAAKNELQLADFGTNSQDIAALFLINQTGKLTNIEKNQFLEKNTLSALARKWSSLPMGPGELSFYPKQNRSCMTYHILKNHYEHY